MTPGTTLYASYVVDTLHVRGGSTVALAGGIVTGKVSNITEPGGNPLVELHGHLEPYREGRWFFSLSEAKDQLADEVERRADDLLNQAKLIRAEANVDRQNAIDRAINILNGIVTPTEAA